MLIKLPKNYHNHDNNKKCTGCGDKAKWHMKSKLLHTTYNGTHNSSLMSHYSLLRLCVGKHVRAVATAVNVLARDFLKRPSANQVSTLLPSPKQTTPSTTQQNVIRERNNNNNAGVGQ
jgi:hypothetical protein